MLNNTGYTRTQKITLQYYTSLLTEVMIRMLSSVWVLGPGFGLENRMLVNILQNMNCFANLADWLSLQSENDCFLCACIFSTADRQRSRVACRTNGPMSALQFASTPKAITSPVKVARRKLAGCHAQSRQRRTGHRCSQNLSTSRSDHIYSDEVRVDADWREGGPEGEGRRRNWAERKGDWQ